MTAPHPKSVLSPELLPSSIAIFTLVALSAFNSLGVAAALPDLAADLGDVELLPWVVTSYLLVAGVSTVLAGALIDSVGLKSVFIGAVSTFLLGSLLGGLAPSMPLLIAARVVQGIGGGGIISLGLAGVNILFPPHLVGRAFAANSTVWGVMGVAGPGVAAFLLTFASWEWIFFINVPLATVAMLAGLRAMPPRPVDRPEISVDAFGLVLVFLFNLAAVAAVILLDMRSAALIVGAIVVAIVYLWHAHRSASPVMMPKHLLHEPFGLLAWSVSLLVAGGIAVESFFTLYVRGARGGGDLITAWAVVFFVVGWTVGSNASSRMLDRMAETRAIATGFAISLFGITAATALAFAVAPMPYVFGAMAFVGTGIGMATNAGLTLLQAITPEGESGRSTAAHQFYRNFGFTVGSAVGGAVILFVLAREIGDVEAVRGLLAGGDAADIAGDPAGAIGRGFAAAAAVGLTLELLGLIPLVALRRSLSTKRAAADLVRSEHRRRHTRYVQ